MDGWMDGGKTGLMKEGKKTSPNAVVILGFFVIYIKKKISHYYNFWFSSA